MSEKCNNSKKRRRLLAIAITIIGILWVVILSFAMWKHIIRNTEKNDLNTSIICIDAGHGFSDPGAKNTLIEPKTEAEINYSIASLLMEKLRALGFRVIMLHNGDTIPLDYDTDGDGVFDVNERVNYSDTLDAAIYISIHCDSFPSNSDVQGTRIYFQAAYNSHNGYIASQIADSIDKSGINERKTLTKPMKENDAFFVIRNRKNMISLLVECGFITNASDAQKLTDQTYQSDFAQAIAMGIYEYCN